MLAWLKIQNNDFEPIVLGFFCMAQNLYLLSHRPKRQNQETQGNHADMGRASSFKRMYKNSLHAAFYTYKIAPMKITFDSAKDATNHAQAWRFAGSCDRV